MPKPRRNGIIGEILTRGRIILDLDFKQITLLISSPKPSMDPLKMPAWVETSIPTIHLSVPGTQDVTVITVIFLQRSGRVLEGGSQVFLVLLLDSFGILSSTHRRCLTLTKNRYWVLFKCTMLVCIFQKPILCSCKILKYSRQKTGNLTGSQPELCFCN